MELEEHETSKELDGVFESRDAKCGSDMRGRCPGKVLQEESHSLRRRFWVGGDNAKVSLAAPERPDKGTITIALL